MMESAISALGIKRWRSASRRRRPARLYSFPINTRTPLEIESGEELPALRHRSRRDRQRLRSTRSGSATPMPWTSTTCSSTGSSCSTSTRRSPSALKRQVPLHPGRRIPGHEQAAGRDRRRRWRRRTQRDGGRRRRPVDLLVPRRVVREHPHLPAPLSQRHDLQAGDELSLHAADPRARQRLDRRTTAIQFRSTAPRCAATDPIRPWSASTTCSSRRLRRPADPGVRDEGESLGDIAVLYRSHYQSLELQMELSRRAIPYEIRSGVRFFEQAHIKDVMRI